MSLHVGKLRNWLWVYHSTDPTWNNATAYSVVYIIDDVTKSSKGYTVVTHQGGDQTFQAFEGEWEGGPAVGFMAPFTGHSKDRFLGGTGKFKGITDRWTSTMKGRGPMERTVAWEAEYEIKP